MAKTGISTGAALRERLLDRQRQPLDHRLARKAGRPWPAAPRVDSGDEHVDLATRKFRSRRSV
ncbi:MAG: hypothetical protein WDO13_15045 [Verrucomicrobiota bacterium]